MPPGNSAVLEVAAPARQMRGDFSPRCEFFPANRPAHDPVIARYLRDRMMPSGPILDMQADMKPVTCALDSRRRILVVDDEPLIRWSVAESLTDLGFEVEQAADACGALRAVTTAAKPFGVVVLDLRLPDMTDLSLLGTLRQLLPQTRLILMSAFASAEVVADATAMGVAVISKPFEVDELQRLIGAGLAPA